MIRRSGVEFWVKKNSGFPSANREQVTYPLENFISPSLISEMIFLKVIMKVK